MSDLNGKASIDQQIDGVCDALCAAEDSELAWKLLWARRTLTWVRDNAEGIRGAAATFARVAPRGEETVAEPATVAARETVAGTETVASRATVARQATVARPATVAATVPAQDELDLLLEHPTAREVAAAFPGAVVVVSQPKVQQPEVEERNAAEEDNC